MRRMAQCSRGSRHRLQIWPMVNLADLAGQTPIWCHQGDGANGEACFGQCFGSGQWGSQATDVPRSSQARGIRRRHPSCPCTSWPFSSPPQSQYAVAEALLLLCPGDYRWHRPKWCVPGDGVAGQDAEQSSDVRSRRTRWLFFYMFLGPFCKVAGPISYCLVLLDLYVIFWTSFHWHR